MVNKEDLNAEKYCMSGTKPLIFVRPLSESLSKLHEVIKETAEEDGIEIYDVDDITEINQLLPSIGQSLTIFSNPKKCAAVLQSNRKAIHKLNSKVILLSQKSIPRKTLDKFSKIGLTECVVEPVPPKTLLYKVKLLLRSISTNVENENNQDEEKKISSGYDLESEDTNEKRRVEKGIITDGENVIDMNLKGNLGTDLVLDADDSDDDGKPNYQEDDIHTNWKGKVADTSLSLDEEEKDNDDKENENENYIDAYLRSKKKDNTELDFSEEKDEIEKPKAIRENEEDDYALTKSEKNLALVEEDKKNKKNNKEQEALNDEKYYKGKISNDLNIDFSDDEDDLYQKTKTSDDEDENTERKNREMGLDLAPEEENENDQKPSNDDIEEDLKKLHKDLDSLRLDPEEEKKKKSKEEELKLSKEKKEKDEIAQSEEEEEKQRSLSATGLEELDLDEEEDSSEDENHNVIEKYMKGNVKEAGIVIDEEEIDTRSASNKDDEEKNNRSSDDFGLDLEAEDDRKKRSSDSENELELDNGNSKDGQKKDGHADTEEDIYARKDSKDLDLAVETEDYREENDKNSNDKGNGRLDHESNDFDLKFDDEDSNKNKDNDKDQDDSNYNRVKLSGGLDLEEDDERKKHSAHTEHIQTNLDSRKSLKHQDYDWDINKKKENTENYQNEKKAKSELEITFKEKVDLGEQTIDYRKLHDEFEAITINRVGSSKKNEGPKYYSDDAEKDFLKGIYDDDLNDGASEISEREKEKQEKERKDLVIEPKSNGIEVAIKVLNLYYNKQLNKFDLYEYVCSSLLMNFGAHVYLFNFDQEKRDFIKSYAISDNSNAVEQEVISQFETLYEENKTIWYEKNLPAWSNEKFHTKDNQFFYPYYEGVNKLGYAICLFNNNFEEKNAKSVETILETLRGIFLDDFHKKGFSEKYANEKAPTKAEESGEKSLIKSLFGKLFGRAS